MLVLCDNCHNHYEDSSQTSTCNGVQGSSHAIVAPSALEIHVASTTVAQREGTLRGATGLC